MRVGVTRFDEDAEPQGFSATQRGGRFGPAVQLPFLAEDHPGHRDEVPGAALTKYHRLGGVKERNLLSLTVLEA